MSKLLSESAVLLPLGPDGGRPQSAAAAAAAAVGNVEFKIMDFILARLVK